MKLSCSAHEKSLIFLVSLLPPNGKWKSFFLTGTSHTEPAIMVSSPARGSPMKQIPNRKRQLREGSLPNSGILVLSPPRTRAEIGTGKTQDPFRLPLAQDPNLSDCIHCMAATCSCNYMEDVLASTFASLRKKRVTEIAGSRHLCAKSLLPQFVSRMIQLMHITGEDTFYDLGCGNGSILFQVAYLTGAKCVGVELLPHNAELAREAWATMKPILERHSGRVMPEVEIISGDLSLILNDPLFVENGRKAVLTSNMLFPKSLTHYMSERFRQLPTGARILCFDDLYPHSRSVAAIRDPEAFQKFDMMDYVWQEMSVEWTAAEGRFYIHTRV
jgi:SAM-dependent methyltransferase